MTPRLIVAAATVLLLAGCTAAPAAMPVPSPTPTAVAAAPVAAALPDIPVVSGRIPVARPPQPPVSVEVPAAGIAVPVSAVGLRPDGLMDIPENVAIAGWYSYGPDPLTKTGTTVIAAHVDSLEYGLGPFAGLKNLPAGSEIIVTVANGTKARYQVESITNYPKAQLPVSEVFDREGSRRLALITCGGTFDYTNLTYSDNVVVIAKPVTP
jgi:hypothetical protein